jgi:hypothetical protein
VRKKYDVKVDPESRSVAAFGELFLQFVPYKSEDRPVWSFYNTVFSAETVIIIVGLNIILCEIYAAKWRRNRDELTRNRSEKVKKKATKS